MSTITMLPLVGPPAIFHESPTAPPPRLPVWRTVRAGVANAVKHRRSLLQTGLILILTIMAAELATVYLGRGVRQDIPAQYIPQLIAALAYLLLATLFLRVLTGAYHGRSADDACRGLGVATFRYVVRSIVWILPAVLVAGVGMLVWFGLFGSSLQGPPDRPSPSMILVAIPAALIALWVTSRLLPYPLAGAVGQRGVGLVEAWRATEGNVLRLLGVLVLSDLAAVAVTLVLVLPALLMLALDTAVFGGSAPTLVGLLVAKFVNVLCQIVVNALCFGVMAEIYTRLFVSRSQLDT